ncbi:Ku protein [Rhizobium sp. LjRoot254]|uniref:non-homologous end joining protein Ku n=1 Tax=Rhizobium sp. LjRoot254 TaxID=3342297 RepID=UPI003ECCA256
MAPRANWKGYLKLGELNCAVALYTAASTSDRVSFHMVNRQTGNRLNREFVDSETGKPVERDEQIKGYEVSGGDYVTLEPEEVAAAVPESNRMLEIGDFVNCNDIDDVFFDKPYYLAPADKQSKEVYALIREGLMANKVAAIAQTVLFRRVRTLLIQPHGEGLIASTLHYEYEVRPASDAFKDMPKLKLEPEMLELASHIIDTKMGKFDPSEFNDRYDAALAELVKAKIEGREIKKPKPIKETKPADLLEALRRSASSSKQPAAKRTAKSGAKSQPMRKAG